MAIRIATIKESLLAFNILIGAIKIYVYGLSLHLIQFPLTRTRIEHDDAQIVSRMRSSRLKSSSLILILEIAKEELSCTGVVPATESPMPKSE